ncbi:keratinocyte differentiation-associated protein isoform X2 [Mastomys coucha]|uniref:keratinocyte differentiation-associated protein isoform X2 n=1 Tax=Mastomys coucha TaxID=35658 RepID=UPI0012618189|nr:keratinocyte differentiation-associated protein isoform X2 [Mastomys coucha]
MKIPILPVALVALISLLALQAAQGAALGHPKEDTTYSNYPAETEGLNNEFLNFNKLGSAFKSEDFLNWHVISDMFKKAFPFINWEFFPKT